jgi:cell division protein FtsZ
MEFDIPKNTSQIIKVIGVGGGGSNAVNHMYNMGIKGVDFIVCNTDKQALDISSVPYKIQLGVSLTDGNGAGAVPEIGKNAAIENIEDIKDLLGKNTKMLFVTAGMGGGTGTGAAPVIAGIAKEMGILTVGIVTVPFNFEGKRRRVQAEEGLEQMRQNVDTLLVINNEKLRELTGNLPINNAFSKADDVLTVAAKGIAELISVTGQVNVDFNDVSTVMKDSGVAIMGSASVEGEDRAIRCVQEAMSSPLLNDNNILGAKYVLLNITYGAKEVLMDEITEITDFIQEEAGATADVIWGHAYDPSLGDSLCVTIIATGFKTSPITGADKAPAKTVLPLEDEPMREIKNPLLSATETVKKTNLSSDSFNGNGFNAQVEPIINNEVKTSVENSIVGEEKKEETLETTEWVVKSYATPEFVVNEEVNQEDGFVTPIDTTRKIVHNLEDDSPQNFEIPVTRKITSTGEQQRLNAERIGRIQDLTHKLKRADGLASLESEPAYVRKNISLDFSNPSSASTTSRFGVVGNGQNATLKSNNSFLHDNVD